LQQRHVVAAAALAVALGGLASTVGDPLELGDRVDAAVEDLKAIFVARLPSPYREAVTLVELEGLTVRGAAEMVVSRSRA
jgi:DNA-directed RNA polymerase specialized sigma24 family protein